MRTWLKGDWMETVSGRKFYPMDPDPEQIDPGDIAHALGMLCRFNGHVKRFYSVAEHSYLMSSTFSDPEQAKWALLHDASEAYIGDMIRPLKRNMPDYRTVEDRILVAIAERFALQGTDIPTIVKQADNRILLTERRTLMPAGAGNRWTVDGGNPLPVRIIGWTPTEAAWNWTRRFEKVMKP